MMALWQPIKEWIKEMTKALGIYGTPFYQWCADNLLLVFIICGLIAFIGVILIVILVLSAKASKRKKAIRNAELAAEAAKAAAIAEADAKAKAEEEAKAQAIAEAEAKAKAEEEAKAQAIAEAAAKAEAEAKAQAQEEARIKAEEEAKAKKEAEAKAKKEAEAKAKKEAEAKAKAEAEAKAKAEAEAKAKAETEAKAKKKAELAASAATAKAASEASEGEKSVRYRGKWVICRLVTEAEKPEDREETYFFELRASNGEKLLSSQEYTSLNGAKRGIATHVTNIKNGNFKIALTKKGDYIFKLMSGNNTLLCTGENYSTQVRCERAIESTKRFGETAVIDENVEEHLIKIPAEDDSSAAAPIPDNANGKGKWIIVKTKTAEGVDAYYFELFANNGEKLLSSEEYSTQLGAVNGVETHKKNIEKGNFRIVLTKRGDYIYKLLNGSGQLLCLGEHYKTKRLCQNAVESVKRFALSSPILAESETAK